MRIKTLFSIFLILFLFPIVYSQNTYQVFKSEDINAKNKTILKLIKKTNCKIQVDRAKIINVFWVRLKGEMHKEDFLNGQFLSNMEALYSPYRGKDQIIAETFIYEGEGELVAKSDGRYLYCLSDYLETAYLNDKKMVKVILGLNIDSVFYLAQTTTDTYFVIDKENKILVLKNEGDDVKTYSIQDYVNNHWPDYIK